MSVETSPRNVRRAAAFATAVAVCALLAAVALSCSPPDTDVDSDLAALDRVIEKGRTQTDPTPFSRSDRRLVERVRKKAERLAAMPEEKAPALADSLLRRALQIDPHDDLEMKRELIEVKFLLGLRADAVGDDRRAEALLRESATDLDEYSESRDNYWGCPYQALGFFYSAQGRHTEALEMIAAAAAAERDADDAQYYAALESYVTGDNPKALAYIDKAIAIAERSQYCVLKGFLLLSQRKYDDAEALFEKARKIDGNPGGDAGLGHLAIVGKDYEAAVRHLDAALKRSRVPKHRNRTARANPKEGFDDGFNIDIAHLGLAWVSANQNRHAEAIRQYDAVLERHPDDLLALLGKAASLTGLKRLDDSERLIAEILKQYPKNRYALAELANIRYNQGADDEAERLYRKALAGGADEDYTCPYEGLGLVYLRQGRNDEAKKNFEEAIEINPSIEYKKFNGLAKIYIAEGKLDEAEALSPPVRRELPVRRRGVRAPGRPSQGQDRRRTGRNDPADRRRSVEDDPSPISGAGDRDRKPPERQRSRVFGEPAGSVSGAECGTLSDVRQSVSRSTS